MSDKKPSKASSTDVKVKTEEQEEQTTNAAAPAAIDLTAQIAANNEDLTAQIANAMNLTNSISGLTPGVPAGAIAPGLANLEQLLPRLPTGTTGGAQAGAASATAAPTAASSGQDLALVSMLTNLLTPSDLALPLNDPSLFLPTPFAPGQNANTLQQRQGPAPAPVPVAAPTIAATIPAAAVLPSPIPAVAALPAAIAPAISPALPQPQLLQQLAATYGRQPVLPSVAGMGSTFPPSLMNGLIPPTNNLMPGNLANPDLASLNNVFGAGGLPGAASLNPALAGFPAASLNPGWAGLSAASMNPSLAASLGLNPASLVPGGLNLQGVAPVTASSSSASTATSNMSNSQLQPNLPNSTINTGQLNLNHALASLAQQNPTLLQENLQRQQQANPPPAAAAAAGSCAVEAASGSASSKKSSKPPKKRSSKGDPLIKSREARWIIRYNELLEFRREHGHCRVPHGYAPNRKLSWWVMNQRAQFAHRHQGKKTWLTDDRIQLLNDIGFIWTPHLKKGQGKDKKEKAASGVSTPTDADAEMEEEEDAVEEDNEEDGENKGMKSQEKDEQKSDKEETAKEMSSKSNEEDGKNNKKEDEPDDNEGGKMEEV